MTSDEILKALAAPFAAHEVRFKPQTVAGNRALAAPYINARAVEDRLDAVLGLSGWQDHYEFLDGGCVLCQLSIRVDGEWLTREDVGSPSAQPDAGDRTKAAVSVALKRAAAKWGVGRYLGRIPPQWNDWDPQKRQWVKPPQLPDDFLPRRPAAPKTGDTRIPPQGGSSTAPATITEEQGRKLASLLAQAATKWDIFRQHFKGVERLGQVTQDDYKRAVAMLEQEITTRRMVQQATQANGAAH